MGRPDTAKRVAPRLSGVQIVEYDSTPDPAIYLADDGTVSRRPLAVGDELALSLGERRCAGRVLGDRHRRCDAAETPRCQTHTDTWVCARCRGDCLKDEMDCHVSHDVYLAAFAPDTIKVGVTRTGRLNRRLREQGADRGVRIHRVKNGRIAREIEAEIAEDIPDRVGVSPKIRSLTARVDRETWVDHIEQFSPAEHLVLTYPVSLEEPPIAETLARGEIVGVKGRLVCLRWSGSTFVTDLQDLVGHHIQENTTPRAVQSGLGAFS